MKVPSLLTCAVAVMALAACNKRKNEAGSAAATNDKVTITQASPPAGGTWADVVNATSAGGYLMGNPNAKVKVIEIGSLSCPHCRAFESEGFPTVVEKYVKPGTVSWEFRPYIIHGPIDMAANLIARCNGVKTFYPFVEALYKDQDTWLNKVQTTPQDKLSQIQNLPTNQLFVQMANVLGLQDWAAARGLPQTKSNQCLSDQKMIDTEVQHTSDVNTQYPSFEGTPSFIINGNLLSKTASWDTLKPQLEAAVK